MLLLKDIDKKYGSSTILLFHEWKIDSGIFWIKGGNGTGKTTLFRVITGQTPFSGEVELQHIALKKDPINFRSKISYAEAEPQYPAFITGRELINFYMDIRQSGQDEVDELASIFMMTEFLDHKVGGYSSGMIKKLSLICAFIGDVELYILDEPLITIDLESTIKLYELIRFKAQQGKSFLLSSHHEIDPAKIKVDKFFLIHDKKIITC